jgi:tripartite motif-containing protein 71
MLGTVPGRSGRRSATRRWAIRGLVIALVAGAAALSWTRLSGLLPGASNGDPAQANVVLVIEGPGSGISPHFRRPLAAAWGPDGPIVVSDTGNHRRCVFASNGTFVREIGRSGGAGSESLRQPAGLSVARDGSILVADVQGGQVDEYGPDGTFVRFYRASFPATGPTEWRPTDVALSGNVVYVTDARGVVMFDRDSGRQRARIDSAPPGAVFAMPNGIAASSGVVVVADSNHGRVVALAADGKLTWEFRGADSGGGSMGLPRGIALAGDGSVFVADAFLSEVVHLSRSGALLGHDGGRGVSPGRFMYPNDVDVRGNELLVADKENHRVQVIRFAEASSTPAPGR